MLSDSPTNPEATRRCPRCGETMPADCFRKGAKACTWCVWASPRKRAAARYRDKVKLARSRVNISAPAFVGWYEQQPDRCAYCGLTFSEQKRLRIRRRGGYAIAWDIDRVDSSRPYEPGNLALSCFVCNMAKGDMLSGAEARIIGRAVREVWDARLNKPPFSSLRGGLALEPLDEDE